MSGVPSAATFDPFHAAGLIGLDISDAAVKARRDAAGSGGSGFLDPEDDPFLATLAELPGFWVRPTGTPGKFDITCPNIESHTQRADTGCARLPGGGYECHHGGCQGWDTNDFKNKIAQLADEHSVATPLARVFGLDGVAAAAKAEQAAQAAKAQAAIQASGKIILGSDMLLMPGHPFVPPGGLTGMRFITPFLARGMATICAGHPGVGKGVFTVALALSVATGQGGILYGTHLSSGLAKQEIDRCGAVLILSAEDSVEIMRMRFAAKAQHLGITDQDLIHPIVVMPPAVGDLRVLLKQSDRSGKVEPGAGWERFKGKIDNLRTLDPAQDVALIIVDTLAASIAIEDENSNSVMTQVGVMIGELARDKDAAIMFVHHTSKGNHAGGNTAAMVRGASSIVGGARFVVRIEDHTPVAGQVYDPELKTVLGAKSNHSPKSASTLHYRLQGLNIVVNEDRKAEIAKGNFTRLENVGIYVPVENPRAVTQGNLPIATALRAIKDYAQGGFGTPAPQVTPETLAALKSRKLVTEDAKGNLGLTSAGEDELAKGLDADADPFDGTFAKP